MELPNAEHSEKWKGDKKMKNYFLKILKQIFQILCSKDH